IDFDPCGGGVIFQKRSLVARMILDGLLNAEASSIIHFAQIRYLALSWAARGAVRFHQHPVVMGLAVFLAAYSSQEHARR
ncbi:MAG: hypothetical protein ONB43_19605, partial [candidate division KSB1 bacterium]|nr:hypothetical protein [candidate division KSB1 bacterium]